MSTTAPVVTVVGNTLFSSSPVNNQWYSTPPDVLIPGATGQTFLPPANGNYFVRLIQGSCLSDKSNTVNFIFTGVTQTNPPKELLQLFPKRDH
jgi:hypothetical protein